MKNRIFGIPLGVLALCCLGWTLQAQTSGGVNTTQLLPGYLKREVYTNIIGVKLSNLTNSAKFPDHPDVVGLVNLFESPSGNGDTVNYGVRLSGFILPPTTGEYQFYLAADDEGALFLSRDESPSNLVQIAWEPGWSMPRNWLGPASGRTNNENISPPIPLEAGKKYFVTALMQQGWGGDTLGVAWKLPGGEPPANGSPPIDGRYLATYHPYAISNYVTVVASDDSAAEMSPMLPAFDTGAFTFKRSGPTNEALPVFYSVSGTATPGTDYQALPGYVTIPAGATEATVLVYPIDELVYEPTETVILTIEPTPISATYGFYLKGTPSTATVFLHDNDSVPPPPSATFVPKGAVWKYWANGTAPGDGWKSLDYNDLQWPAGPAQLGFGDGDEATLLPGPQVNGTWIITAYFRHVFAATNVAGITNLVLDLLRDDGAVVYLNGMEITRDNLPIGVINYQALATASVGGADESAFYSRAVPANLLHEGRNVLAVEVHQVNVSSTDLSFDLALRTGNDAPPASNHPPVVAIVSPKATNVYNAPTNIAIYAAVTDAEGVATIGQVEFYAGTNRLAVFTSPSSPNAGYYYYTWTNPPPGQHVLTVVAIDGQGAAGHAQVGIVVNGPTDLPVVNVVATDASAREISPLLDVIPDSGLFTFSRTGSTNNALTLYFMVGGTASNGVDYAAIPRTITIPAGQTEATVMIDVLDDALFEGDETVVISLASPNPNCCYRVGEKANATVVIHDDERSPLPVVTVVATDAEAAEPNPVPPGMGIPTILNMGTFTISRTGPTNEPLMVFFNFASNSVTGTGGAQIANLAINGVDFEAIESPVTIPAGATSVVVQVIPIDDDLIEPTEWAWLFLYEPTTFAPVYTIGQPGAAMVAILDNDQPPPPVVTIVATDAEAAEPNPQAMNPYVNTGQFTVYRTGPTSNALSVAFDIGGTASNGVDYLKINNYVVIPAGATSAPIAIIPKVDNLAEGTEAVRISIPVPPVPMVIPTPPPAYWPGTPSEAVVRILDFQTNTSSLPIVTVVATDAEAAEPNPVPPGMGMPTILNMGTFTISRTGPTNEPLAVFFNLASNSVDSSGAQLANLAINGVDFEYIESPVTIPAGATSVVVQVIPIDDAWIEATEIALLQLYEPTTFAPVYTIGQPGAAMVSILDNDQLVPGITVTIRATDAEAAEPNPLAMNPYVNSGQFTVYRTGPTSNALSVFFDIGGTASNGVDYVKIDDYVVIPVGATSAPIAIVPLGDNLAEGTETVRINIPVPPVPNRYPTPPPAYMPGNPSEAEVRILDYPPVTNHSPTISIFSPLNGAQFTAPANLYIRAEAHDSVDAIRLVEFFAGDKLLGSRPAESNSVGFTLVWTNVMPGDYVLTARATDAAGISAVSAPVRITVGERTPRVIRVLPAGYAPGVKLLVKLNATPTASVLAWAVEDQPPAGWTVGLISGGGEFDASVGKVKFGPFLDNLTRTLTYELTPPNDAVGAYHFTGIASFDGVSQAIGGASVIGLRLHPADASPADWRITIDELTAYSSAWRQGGSNYTVGGNNSGADYHYTPVSFVTRAGMLWKGGEFYTLDPAVTTPPLCWVNLPAVQANGFDDPAGTPETCPAQSSMPASYVGGAALTVTLAIQPKAGTRAYAIEETVPAGWTVSAMSDNGIFQASTRKIRWGLYLVATNRMFTYTVVPAATTAGVCVFQGVASFDGVDVPIAGRRIITSDGTTPPPTINSATKNESGLPTFTFVGEAGKTYVIEYSTDLKNWFPVNTVTTTTGVISHTDTDAPTLEQRYYRARLLP